MKLKIKIEKPKDKYTNKTENKSELEIQSEELLRYIESDRAILKDYFAQMAESDHIESFEEEVDCKIVSYRRANANLICACAHIATSTDELAARYSDLTKGIGRKHLPTAPANSVIDMEESKSKSFACGLNFYKLFLIFFIGSFMGVVIETAWCLLKNGYIESRAGLVIGPFNLLYGVGAVALTAALYRFRNNRKWISFAGGMAVGSAVEYACSFLQEAVFGSRSWDYSSMPFNLNGRICLLYSVFWGVLGAVWVKTLYPWVARFILKIPNKAGKTVCLVLLVFFVLDALLTLLCVWRWSQRMAFVPASNMLLELIDALFPNEKMSLIFANMVFR